MSAVTFYCESPRRALSMRFEAAAPQSEHARMPCIAGATGGKPNMRRVRTARNDADLQRLATRYPKGWDRYWGAIHEAAHAVVARALHLPLTTVNMRQVTVNYPNTPRRALHSSIVSASGDAACVLFLGFHRTGVADDDAQLRRLHALKLSDDDIARLMMRAKRTALRLVASSRNEIFAVADALRAARTLSQDEVDAAILQSRR